MERKKIRYGKIKKLMFKEFVGEDPGWTWMHLCLLRPAKNSQGCFPKGSMNIECS